MSDIKLYLVQHGLAVDKTDNPERPLSEKGKQQTHAIAKKLLVSEIAVAQIFHSGKLRAAETAQIFASTLQVEIVSMVDYLSPNDDVKKFTQDMVIDNTLYVGHLPHLEKLVAYLVTGNEDSTILKFKNSAVACLEKADDLHRLQWYITPELAAK